MVRRHPLPPASRHAPPRRWLISDPRLDPGVERLLAFVPPGSAILVRHDALPPRARWRLFRRLAACARLRRLTLWLAGTAHQAARWGADGVYLRQHDAGQAVQARRLGLKIAMPVHDQAEARRAARAQADVLFISPLYPTRSHPGIAPLSTAGWLRLARLAGGQPIALGGMTAARAHRLMRQAASQGTSPGWAAIDAWSVMAKEKYAQRAAYQKRKAVPT
ncbi:thiamine phosphate synthase [Sphingopyxis sp. MWB1]|uniref:thiamine phosphate synthase n=1 Tax=Sphingopyxis sp. MWB1 TaxID=1537715 RepID=UPI00051A2028|nr:thiamine phosphate synthase [Sphingopyxis sp. MWB1]